MSKLFGYFIVAGVGLLVDVTVFFGLIYIFGAHYMIAGASGFIVGFIVNFTVGRKYVFKHGHRYSSSSHEFYSVLLISLISLLIHQGVLYVSVDYLMLSVEISKFLAVSTSFIWNFLGRKHVYS